MVQPVFLAVFLFIIGAKASEIPLDSSDDYILLVEDDKPADPNTAAATAFSAPHFASKRDTRNINDISRRLRDMFIEYKKRQNAFQFGLGKRAPFSFGLGKRSQLAPVQDFDTSEDYAEEVVADQDPTAESVNSPSEDMEKRARQFAFGLGKRGNNKGKMFAFGLGKRNLRVLGKRPLSQKQFSFGLGKRAGYEPFAFGLGKRGRQNAFQFGLGKRGGYDSQRFAFGLGKRSYLSTEDDIDDSVPVGDSFPRSGNHHHHHVFAATSDDGGATADEDASIDSVAHRHEVMDGGFGSGGGAARAHNRLAAFRFGLGKRSVDAGDAGGVAGARNGAVIAATTAPDSVAQDSDDKDTALFHAVDEFHD